MGVETPCMDTHCSLPPSPDPIFTGLYKTYEKVHPLTALFLFRLELIVHS